MRLILVVKLAERMKRGIVALLFVLGLAAQQAAADPVVITNPSFELPDVGGAWSVSIPDGWVGSPGLSDAFVESSASVGFSGGDGAQYAGLDTVGSYIYQDLGVAFSPNTRYTIDIAGAHRSGFGHGTMDFGLWSSDAIGSDIGTPGFMDLQGVWTGSGNPDGDDMFNVLRDASAVHAIGSGALGDVYSYVTGGSVPSGNVVVFIRDATGSRISFDNIRLDATAIPEPAAATMLVGCCTVFATRRKRK